jgi:hypothetical protein
LEDIVKADFYLHFSLKRLCEDGELFSLDQDVVFVLVDCFDSHHSAVGEVERQGFDVLYCTGRNLKSIAHGLRLIEPLSDIDAV